MIANPNITHTQVESPSLTVRPGETRVNHPDSDPPCTPNCAVLRIGSVPVSTPRERPADADPGGLAVNVSGIGHRAPRLIARFEANIHYDTGQGLGSYPTDTR